MANNPNILNEVQVSSQQALTGKQSGLTNHSLEKVKELNSETDRSEQLNHNLQHKMSPSKNQHKTQERFVKNSLVKNDILVDDQNANDTE